MDNKEQWADQALKSLEGMESAVPKDDLFDKIIAKIPVDSESRIISLKQLSWAAVAASVVITINIYAVKLQSDSLQSTPGSKEEQISLLTDYTF